VNIQAGCLGESESLLPHPHEDPSSEGETRNISERTGHPGRSNYRSRALMGKGEIQTYGSEKKRSGGLEEGGKMGCAEDADSKGRREGRKGNSQRVQGQKKAKRVPKKKE
jgi:hypothetical protein